MNFAEHARGIKVVAFVAMLGYSGASAAASGSFELDVPVTNATSIEVSNGSGAVKVKGADVDQVTIRAHITVDERYAKRDPRRANSMVAAIKRSPPVKSEGGEIVIEQPKQRTHRRHVSISYEILVPRDAQVKVRSESGDVHVSGVSGPVDATSETGVVTLAAIRTATNAVNGS